MPAGFYRTLMSGQFHRIFRPDIVMHFVNVTLVHRYINNRFITGRLPTYLADVENTLSN